MRKILIALKWRKLRIRVWNKRLQHQLNLLMTRMNLSLSCSLHISWGPYYGGSAVVDRQGRKAVIMVQIPYDGHISPNEREVMTTFHLSKKTLPYFILFHEFSHLLDTLPFIHANKKHSLQKHQERLKNAILMATDYRKLSFEERADRFAFEQCQNLFQKVS